MLGHSHKSTASDSSEVVIRLNNLERSFEKEGGSGFRPGNRVRRMSRAESSGPKKPRRGGQEEKTHERNGEGNESKDG